MPRAAALALMLLAPLPGLAQDADPSNQLIEGYVACAMGEGLPDKTVTTLGLYGWTHEEDAEMGVVNFQPGVGTETFAYMSLTPGYCHVESTTLGTARAQELLGYLSLSGQVSALFLFVVSLCGITLGPLIPGVLNDYVFRDEKMLGRSLALTLGCASILTATAFRLTFGPYRTSYRRDVEPPDEEG